MLAAAVCLLLIFLFVLHRHQASSRARAAASGLYDADDLATDKVPWFETRVYIEDDDLTCDFTMRVEYAELSSRDLLLECIARAAFEATEISFDFSTACLEILQHSDSTIVVRTDADCRRARGASGLRITTGARATPVTQPNGKAARTAGPREGSLLYTEPEGEAEEQDGVELIL